MSRMIGILALALPVATGLGYLALGGAGASFLDSISESYYTLLRDFFVGTLCAVAFFLFAYHGYNPRENRIFNLCAILAVAIAFSPMNTKPARPGVEAGSCNYPVAMTDTCVGQGDYVLWLNGRLQQEHVGLLGVVHFVCAAILFFLLGYVSLDVFTMTDKDRDPESRKDPTPEKLGGTGSTSPAAGSSGAAWRPLASARLSSS